MIRVRNNMFCQLVIWVLFGTIECLDFQFTRACLNFLVKYWNQRSIVKLAYLDEVRICSGMLLQINNYDSIRGIIRFQWKFETSELQRCEQWIISLHFYFLGFHNAKHTRLWESQHLATHCILAHRHRYRLMRAQIPLSQLETVRERQIIFGFINENDLVVAQHNRLDWWPFYGFGDRN